MHDSSIHLPRRRAFPVRGKTIPRRAYEVALCLQYEDIHRSRSPRSPKPPDLHGRCSSYLVPANHIEQRHFQIAHFTSRFPSITSFSVDGARPIICHQYSYAQSYPDDTFVRRIESMLSCALFNKKWDGWLPQWFTKTILRSTSLVILNWTFYSHRWASMRDAC